MPCWSKYFSLFNECRKIRSERKIFFYQNFLSILQLRYGPISDFLNIFCWCIAHTNVRNLNFKLCNPLKFFRPEAPHKITLTTCSGGKHQKTWKFLYQMCTKNAFHDAYIADKRGNNTILRFFKNPEKITKNPGIPEKLEKSRDSGINPGRWQRWFLYIL